MSTYITVHRVLSMPVSLPVRGADGLAKRAPYGGVERSAFLRSRSKRICAAMPPEWRNLLHPLGKPRACGLR